MQSKKQNMSRENLQVQDSINRNCSESKSTSWNLVLHTHYKSSFQGTIEISKVNSIVVVQQLSRLSVTPRTAACQCPLSCTMHWSLLKFMSIESVMLSNHLISSHLNSMGQVLKLRVVPSTSLVTQSCMTLFNPMDCYPPGSCVHGNSSGKFTGEACHALQGIFSTQRSNPGILHCRWILQHLSLQGSP